MAASIGLLVGCSQVEQDFTNVNNLSDGALVEKVIFEVLPIKDVDAPETRASAVPNGGTVGFIWEATDTVGIYPDKGSQVYFNIEDGVGTNSVSFNGGGWALKQNSTYTSYYPFVGDIYLKRDKIPVSFAGQKQIGTTSPFIGARYYLATGASTSENGVLRFSYSTLNTIINVNAKLPAGTYTKMSLTVEEPLFIEEGTYSLDDHVIVGTKFTNTLEIELEDVVLTEEGTIPIYIMSAPVDLKDKQVAVMVMTSDGKGFKCVKTPSKAYEAGTRYGLTCDRMESESQPNNVIYYTSTDGNIVTPSKTDVFGANLTSNVYQNGRGIMTFDGDVTSIGFYAFYGCTTMKSISIPDSVTSIGGYAFEYNHNLTGITIPDSVTTIGDGVFSSCFALKSFDGKYASSDGLFLIDSGTILAAAYGGIEDGHLTIPDGVTSIGTSAFGGCPSLTNITIPDSVTLIGYAAFSLCSNLENIVIPDSVTSIGAFAFNGCSQLNHIEIPENVSSIGSRAFYDCTSLTSIIVLSETPPSGESEMFGNSNNAPIYVPSGSVNAYTSASYWSDYADRIQTISSPVPIPEAIDLGLPSGIKWASFNLGATKPEEYGDYYAWGEVTPKERYDWDTYVWCNGSSMTLTKYNSDSQYGDVDNKTVLDLEDDAAHCALQGSWRIPTESEIIDLQSYCTWIPSTMNGINGYWVYGNKEGYQNKRIFLPDSGYKTGTDLHLSDDNGFAGYYWSSSRQYYNRRGVTLYFYKYSIAAMFTQSEYRYLGLTIRPVCSEN